MTQKETTKGTVRNGRKSKDGMAYNANHNTLEATRTQQSHIDQERAELNMYIQFKRDGSMSFIKGGSGGFDAKKHEMKRYKELYGEGLEAKNERYTKTRHTERCRTIKDLYQDPKTAPLETIFQIGNSKDKMGSNFRTKSLLNAWTETVQFMQQKYGENMHFLDAALHRDESVDHIHCRVAFVGRDRHGYAVPSQNSALAAMGIERPDPGRANTKYNNPTITFTDELRETFYQACERQGIQIDRNVISHSKRQVEILEYKCDQYRIENQELEQEKQGHIQAAMEAKAREQESEQKAQEAQEALEQVTKDKDALIEQITALRASEAVLAAKNEHLSDYNTKLEERKAEVIQEGQAIVKENQQLKAANEQLTGTTQLLRKQVEQLQAEVDSLEIQLGSLQQAKTAAERETERAKADRAAALDAAKKMEEHQKHLFELHQSRLLRQYETIPAQKEKRNLRGQVVQEARPECVVVNKEDLERVENQARYNIHVHYTEATMKELDKKISENEIIQGLQAQVEQQQKEITSLRSDNERKGRKLQDREWAVEQYEKTLSQHGLGHYILDRTEHEHEWNWKQ